MASAKVGLPGCGNPTPIATIIEKRFSDCGYVKRVSDLSVRGHVSLRGRALRLMMVFGGGPSPMSFAGWASEPAPQPFLRDRSTSVPSVARQAHPRDAAERGTSLPAFSAAVIRIRQWPPSSIDTRFRASTASASARRSCARSQQRPFETRAARPGARPSFSGARTASPGG